MIEDLERIFGAKVIAKRHLRCWWFSTEKMTVVAETEDDIISKASPIVRKFVGQHIKNLADWLRLQGGFEYKELQIGDYEDHQEERKEAGV